MWRARSGTPRAPRPAGDVQQAREVAGHQLVGAGRGRVARLLLAEPPGDLGEVDAEGAAEAAADVGRPPSRAAPAPPPPRERRARALALAEQAQHVARVVVGRPSPTRAHGRVEAVRSARNWVNSQRPGGHRARRLLLGRPGEELGVAVAHHRRARAGGHHHRVVAREAPRAPRRATRRACSGWPDDPARLAAAGLRARDRHLDARRAPAPCAAARQTDGATTSDRHVRMSIARIG